MPRPSIANAITPALFRLWSALNPIVAQDHHRLARSLRYTDSDTVRRYLGELQAAGLAVAQPAASGRVLWRRDGAATKLGDGARSSRCLCCREEFVAEHRYNRMCGRCKRVGHDPFNSTRTRTVAVKRPPVLPARSVPRGRGPPWL